MIQSIGFLIHTFGIFSTSLHIVVHDDGSEAEALSNGSSIFCPLGWYVSCLLCITTHKHIPKISEYECCFFVELRFMTMKIGLSSSLVPNIFPFLVWGRRELSNALWLVVLVFHVLLGR